MVEKTSLRNWLCVGVLGWVAAGCGVLPMPSSRSDEIAELKSRVVELQKKAARAEVELARLRDEMSTLRGPLAARTTIPSASSMPRALAPSAAGADGASHPDLAVEPAVEIEESDLDPQPVVAALAQPPVVDTLEPVTPAAQTEYDRAYTLHHQGRFAESEAAFGDFLERFPRSELADNASYWIGESRYSRGDLAGALVAFQLTVERYPTGNKSADSLLKVGQCFEGLADRESAKAAYEAVLERFSGSAAAEVARQRRAALR